MQVERLTDTEILHLGWATLARELGLNATVRFAALAMTRAGAKRPAASRVLGTAKVRRTATARRRGEKAATAGA